MPMSERHIADRLTAWSSVLYIDPPTPIVSISRHRISYGSKIEVLRPHLARCTPIVLPGSRRPGMVRVTEELTRLQIGSAIDRLGPSTVVRVIASDLPVFERSGRERRVVFATDDTASGFELMGLPESQIRRHEARLARDCDLVIAVSEPIAAKWRAQGCEVVVIPNGCDAERFAETDRADWPADVRLSAPIAGFAGQINDRLDIGLLEATAARGSSVLLVGPMSRTFNFNRLTALLERPNVQWVGPKPFEEMPSYLRAMHVGLTPYANTAFNRASVPLKTLEYLAAGRAVVSADLPAARELGTRHITLASDPHDFSEAVRARLREPLSVEIAEERQEFAKAHSWSVRAQQFAVAIGIGQEPSADNST